MRDLTTLAFTDDVKLHEECGVFGIFGHDDAAALTVLGLHALQHRGQEAGGIVSFDGSQFHQERRVGVIGDTFTDRALIDRLAGSRSIGHVRYATHGGSRERNIQPLFAEFSGGGFAVAHNGNLTNAVTLQDRLQRRGSIFQSTSDTEVIIHLIAASSGTTLLERIVDALAQVRGAYSLVFMTEDRIIAARDPHGFRPLVLGRLGDAVIVCSETCALDLINATYVRDVEPGEILMISKQGVKSIKPFPPQPLAHCVFEHVYFARPDSYVFGRSVNDVRTEFGRQLAREAPVDADVVVPIPDSGVCAAIGFSEQSDTPMRFGLIRNHYIGRTFIEPQQSIRHFGVKIKLNSVRSILEGKRVVLIDDSIVRGTTSRKIVKLIKAAGAKEVHMRISCPPTISPCSYGVDTPRRSELIAATHTIEEIQTYLGADSLAYLSLPGMLNAVAPSQRSYCTSCYTGTYPVEFPRDSHSYLQLALKLDKVG
jgi:amidophosphoribosyltransferase